MLDKQTFQKIARLALPMAGIQLITVCSCFLCMTMLAQLGHTVLAASALIFTTQISIMVIGMSILMVLSILIGHAYGAQNYSAIGGFMQHGWMLAILISIPIMIFYWHISAILIFFGQKKPLADIVQVFFHPYILGVIPMLLSVCNQQLCYGVHRQKLAVLTGIFQVIILLITAYLLIFGKFGLPHLGAAGLGYAMAAQAWFYFLFTTLFFYYDDYFKPFALFHYRLSKNWNQLTQIFKFGWPISLQMSGEMISFFIIVAMVGWVSTNALAAYQVILQYLFLVIIPIFSLSQASGVLVGQACGSKQFTEIKKLGYGSMQLALAISLITAFIFLLFPRSLATLYLDVNNPINAETVHLVVILFAITAISQIFDAVRNVITGALRGLFDMRFSMFIGLGGIWLLGIPLSYFLAFPLHLGVVGIAIGSALGMLAGTLVIVYRWHLKS
jgi:MATE family multidrug resistance protein